MMLACTGLCAVHMIVSQQTLEQYWHMSDLWL